MSTVSEDIDVDDIPEVKYTINIQPYIIYTWDKDEQDSSDSANGAALGSLINIQARNVSGATRCVELA